MLSSLGDYGGETKTHALLPDSLAIDAGDAASCPATDQRGVNRGACDIGAFESQGFYLTISGGNNQTVMTNTTFTDPLSVTVTANVIIEPIGSGNVITFTAPSSGASLSPTLVSSTTDSSGQAGVVVTANSITGTYVVTATAKNISSSVWFTLTNGSDTIELYLPIVIKEN